MNRDDSATATDWLRVAIYTIEYSARTGIIIALPTFAVWNLIMPAVFELPHINLLQAWGLIFLSGLFLRTKVSFVEEGG